VTLSDTPLQDGSPVWHQVDHKLASLMLAQVFEDFSKIATEDLQHIQYQNLGNSNSMATPSARLEMHRLRSGELVAQHYAVYCEVWHSQYKLSTGSGTWRDSPTAASVRPETSCQESSVTQSGMSS